MPETAYIQQAISTTKQKQQNADYKKYVADVYVRQMKQQFQQRIYDYTRSNLGF